MINPFMARGLTKSDQINEEHRRTQFWMTLFNTIQQVLGFWWILAYAHTVTSCIFKPGFLSGSNSAAPNQSEWQNVSKCVFFPRIVSLSLDGIRMNQTSCLLAYLDHICRQCNACQIEAAVADVAADYEVYKDVTSAGTVRCLVKLITNQGLVPSVLGNLATVLSHWHHVSFTIRVWWI